MERQEWSLRNILLQNPELDAGAAAVSLQQRLNAALHQVEPTAHASVTLESDWMAIDVDPGSSAPDAHARLLAAVAAAKAAWYRELLAATGAEGAEGPRPGPLTHEQ